MTVVEFTFAIDIGNLIIITLRYCIVCTLRYVVTISTLQLIDECPGFYFIVKFIVIGEPEINILVSMKYARTRT